MQNTLSSSSPRFWARSGFAWSEQRAYLFDIDGTLLLSRDRVHFESFAAAIEAIVGWPARMEGVSIHGSTDTKILRDACENSGLDADMTDAAFPAMLAYMRAHVAERRDQLDLAVLPGVPETLHFLNNQGALLGVATGNLEEIGWTKLEAAGLRSFFRFGGFSDHFPVRAELIGHAAQTARTLAQDSTASVCVVGDTPRDIAAARANSLSVIAVATGHFSFDELQALEPDLCVSSLADLLTLSAAHGVAQ